MENKKIFILRSLSEGGQTFKDLIAWQEGHRLVIAVYKITKEFPREEIYSLVDQMRRAAVSVTSNLAEGFGRHSYKEKANFYRIAEGSLTELENQLLVSRDIGYLKSSDFNNLQEQLNLTHRLLCGLISKTRSFINSNLQSPISILFAFILISILYSLFSIPTAHAARINAPANYLNPSSSTLYTGLVGWWTFDGPNMKNNVKDSSGQNNNGYMKNFTSTSSAVVAGKLGQGLKFDGVDDYVNLGNGAVPNLKGNQFTVALWFKPSKPISQWNSWSGLISQSASSPYPFSIRKNAAANNIEFLINGNGLQTTLSPSANTWYFITATFNSSVGRGFYVNGAFSTSDGYTTLVDSYSSPFYLGLDYNIGQSRNFPGSLDDVRIYNRALSAKEIRQLYLQGQATIGATQVATSTASGSGLTTLNTGLVGYWTFNNQDMNWTSATAGTVRDMSGNNNTGTLTNMNRATAPVIGKIGQGLKFDGVGSYVNTNKNLSTFMSVSTGTISVWVKFNTKGTGTGCGNGTGGSIITDTGGGYIWLGQDSLGICFGGSDGGNKNTYYNNYSTGIWYHLVYLHSGGYLYLYLNGVNVSSMAFGDIYRMDSPVVIGKDWANIYFNGSLDDVRIYNRALTAKEIRQLYLQGQATIGATQVATSTASGSGLTTLNTGLVGYWTFNNQDMNWTSATAGTVRDMSGNNNTGTLTNMNRATAPVIGKMGQGLKFDGVDDYVNVSSSALSLAGSSDFTVSAWVKLSRSFSDSNKRVLQESSGVSSGYEISVTTGMKPQFFVGDNPAVSLARFETGLSINRWYHIVGTYSNSADTAGIYVNGIAGATTTASGFSGQTANILYIGDVNGSGGRFFPGLVDDVRIYNRALSAKEIQQLYMMGR